MKAQLNFSQITLDSTGSSNDYPRGYQVFVSTDGTTWGSAIASGAGTSAVVTVSFSAQAARFIKITQTGSSSNWWSIHELNVFGTPLPSLAPLPRAGWIASASSSSSLDVPGRAIDGDSSTRWSTGTPQVSSGQFFQLDMTAPQLFSQIVLDASGSPSDYPRGYQVFISNDGVSWGTAIASSSGNSAKLTITFGLQAARYLKITQTGTSSNWWSIHEINVFGFGPSVLARSGWTASAFATCQTDVPANAIDGNLSTRWSSGIPQAANQWFQIDMKSATAFSQVVLDAGSSNGDFPHAFNVVISNDGQSWSPPVVSGTGSGQLVTITFPVQTARFFRINLTGGASNWWSIHELNVYGAPPVEGCTALSGAGFNAGQSVSLQATALSGAASPTVSQSFSPPFLFVVPQTLPVSEGNLGNQSAQLVLTTATETITCKYTGLASVSSPTDPADAALGRIAAFQGCDQLCPMVGGSLFVNGLALTVLGADASQPSTTVALVGPTIAPLAPVTPLADNDPNFPAVGDAVPTDPNDIHEGHLATPTTVVHPPLTNDDLTTNPLDVGYVDTVDPDVVISQ